jgi:hypothetical protein
VQVSEHLLEVLVEVALVVLLQEVVARVVV